MPSTQTGFLDVDYSTLSRTPSLQVWGIPDRVFATETADFTKRLQEKSITEVYVAPVVYQPIPNARYRPSEEAGGKIERYATRKLKHALEKDFVVLDEPREGAVEVKLALTDMMCSNVWFNSILLIVFVPLDMGGVSGEMEFVDTTTGKPLVAMTLTREGTPFIFFETFNKHGHVRHGIKKWALLTNDILTGEKRIGVSE